MKALVFIALLLVWSPAFGQAKCEKNNFVLDASRSTLTFTSTAPAEKIVGSAAEVSGSVCLDLDAMNGTGTLTFPVDKMNTGNNLRDRHLKSKDWLDAKSNPTITFQVLKFESTKDVVKKDSQVEFTAQVSGTVTVNGKSAPGTAEVKVKLDTAKGIARFEPTLKIKLADHDVKGKKGVVGDKVGETIDITGVLYAKGSK